MSEKSNDGKANLEGRRKKRFGSRRTVKKPETVSGNISASDSLVEDTKELIPQSSAATAQIRNSPDDRNPFVEADVQNKEEETEELDAAIAASGFHARSKELRSHWQRKNPFNTSSEHDGLANEGNNPFLPSELQPYKAQQLNGKCSEKPNLPTPRKVSNLNSSPRERDIAPQVEVEKVMDCVNDAVRLLERTDNNDQGKSGNMVHQSKEPLLRRKKIICGILIAVFTFATGIILIYYAVVGF